MANWSDMGHAMRRRSGAPSSHHGAAAMGNPRSIATPEEVINSAEHANSARKYMGMELPMNNVSGHPDRGTLMPKKNTQAADPTAGGKANRQNVERKGAQFRITAKMPAPINIEAAPTMANARIIPSVSGRQAPNFGDGMNSAY
jgi:hypothetical protein